MLWVKCLRKVSGKFCVINYIFFVCKRLKGHEIFLTGFNFLCKTTNCEMVQFKKARKIGVYGHGDYRPG